jgi:predicted DNA-binding ribbon-helix-helix protein
MGDGDLGRDQIFDADIDMRMDTTDELGDVGTSFDLTLGRTSEQKEKSGQFRFGEGDEGLACPFHRCDRQISRGDWLILKVMADVRELCYNMLLEKVSSQGIYHEQDRKYGSAIRIWSRRGRFDGLQQDLGGVSPMFVELRGAPTLQKSNKLLHFSTIGHPVRRRGILHRKSQ